MRTKNDCQIRNKIVSTLMKFRAHPQKRLGLATCRSAVRCCAVLIYLGCAADGGNFREEIRGVHKPIDDVGTDVGQQRLLVNGVLYFRHVRQILHRETASLAHRHSIRYNHRNNCTTQQWLLTLFTPLFEFISCATVDAVLISVAPSS